MTATHRSTPAFGRESETIYAKVRRLEAENAIFRIHIADVHNRLRHNFQFAIDTACDDFFRASSGIAILRQASGDLPSPQMSATVPSPQ